jgi:hypothetical protein
MSAERAVDAESTIDDERVVTEILARIESDKFCAGIFSRRRRRDGSRADRSLHARTALVARPRARVLQRAQLEDCHRVGDQAS